MKRMNESQCVVAITIYINYAHVAQQYFLPHFINYIGVDGSNKKLEYTRLAWLLLFGQKG